MTPVRHGKARIKIRRRRARLIARVVADTMRRGAGEGACEAMSRNKETVQKYMDAFRRTDHAEVLSCLTDDVEWVIPGVFHIRGKDAFDQEIENDAFVGSPTIRVTRMTEEDDVVIAEGSVRAARREGGFLNAVFCDVFVMESAKVRHLTSYLMEVEEERDLP